MMRIENLKTPSKGKIHIKCFTVQVINDLIPRVTHHNSDFPDVKLIPHDFNISFNQGLSANIKQYFRNNSGGRICYTHPFLRQELLFLFRFDLNFC